MTHDQMLDTVSAFKRRCGIFLDHSGWRELTTPGGVAMEPYLISAVATAAGRYGDIKATAYEMESVNQEFEPIDIELSSEGMRHLRSMMMSHFDLLLVPESKQWAALLSNEMESIFWGPPEFLEALAEGGGSD